MKALVTAEWTEEGTALLTDLGYEVQIAGWGVTRHALTREALIEAAADASLLLVEEEIVDRAVLDALPELRLIGSARGNPVNVDLAACSERGIPVLHAPARTVSAVADFVMGLILTTCRGITAAERRLRNKGWLAGDERSSGVYRGPELAGRTLGLIGFGALARAVAQRAEFGFDMKVIFCEPGMDGSVDLTLLLETADVISIHRPAEPDGVPLLGADELARLKPSAYVINTSAGGLIDEDALVSALRSRALAGAAMDVFSVEPLPSDSPLRKVDNVVLTPHLAGSTDDVVGRHTDMLCEDVARISRDEVAMWCANPEVFAEVRHAQSVDLTATGDRNTTAT